MDKRCSTGLQFDTMNLKHWNIYIHFRYCKWQKWAYRWRGCRSTHLNSWFWRNMCIQAEVQSLWCLTDCLSHWSSAQYRRTCLLQRLWCLSSSLTCIGTIHLNTDTKTSVGNSPIRVKYSINIYRFNLIEMDCTFKGRH